jgi:adenylate cyclase
MTNDTRQLAAVMFTDMVGYTALMQENEQKARDDRDRHREVLERRIAENQGTILQYFGDGTMCSFASAIQAVHCAMGIQIELQKEPKIPVRIGLHVGDIVFEEDGVYGDAVNVAARIESLSVPGGVLFSDRVYDDIKNHKIFQSNPLGEFKFKNVKRPIAVFALTNSPLTVPSAEQLKGKVPQAIRSVAVLPFANMSSDPENEYFSDGMSEELINAFSKLEEIHVTARTSAFAFKGKNIDIREIGKKLDVDTVLEGSVRKAGNRVRVTAQLISTADGYHLFSETYDRNLEDIFEVQDEIARKITQKLTSKLEGARINKNLVKSPTENLDAYNLYLKGMFYWKKWTTRNINKAIHLFQEAIALEPKFAAAYSWIANSYTVLGARGSLLPEIAYPRGQKYANKALELDDELLESHLSIALVKIFYEWDCAGAHRSIQRAIELNPGSGAAYHVYAMYLQAMGKNEEAEKNMELAIRLDPLAQAFHSHLAAIYFTSRKYDKALLQIERTLEFGANHLGTLELKGWCLIMKGDFEKAIDILEYCLTITGKTGKTVAILGFAFAKAGRMEEAQKCLLQLKERQSLGKQEMLDMEFLLVYVGLGDFDKAFFHLDNIIESRLGGVIYVSKNPGLKEFHEDPRFKATMVKIGIDQKSNNCVEKS